jgi:5-methylcytosine-specific restriction endonuclease McrA
MRSEIKALRKEFNDLRQQKIIVAAGSCLKCQRTADLVFQLELHHKVPIKDALLYPEVSINDPDNIATLCTDCHKAFHVAYEDMEFDAWLEQVPLKEAYKLLEEYREERRIYKQAQIRKHRGR